MGNLKLLKRAVNAMMIGRDGESTNSFRGKYNIIIITTIVLI